MDVGPPPIVEARGIVKQFAGTTALDHVDFAVRRGEVHGLLGENGAGKSTLVKILTGIYGPTSGSIFVDGHEMHFHSPLDARRHGLVAVYQDTEIIGRFTVAQNVLLGDEPTLARSGLVRDRALTQQARAVLGRIGVDIDPGRPASSLGPGERQLLALAKVFYAQRKVVFLDEPSAALAAGDVKRLFQLIHQLKLSGVAIIYISHRLEEIMEICDRVTILKDGRVAGTLAGTEIDSETVIQMMVGRRVDRKNAGSTSGGKGTPPALVVQGLQTSHIHGIDFSVAPGEIVGFTGLLGSGAEEVTGALWGVVHLDAGHITLNGHTLSRGARSPSPHLMRRLGVGFVPSDRKGQGLLPDTSVAGNLAAGVLSQLSVLGVVRAGEERALARRMIGDLDIRPPDPARLVKFLSGGNQQKAVVGRWVAAGARLYLINEPTAGVDVGAIAEIHAIIRRVAQQGAAVIVVSSVIHELLSLCNRVYVMRKGQIVFESPASETSHDEVLAYSIGGTFETPNGHEGVRADA